MNARLNEIVTRAFDETWATHEERESSDADGRLRARRCSASPRRRSRAASTPKTVTLFHGQGCSLCERAREQVSQLQRDLGFSYAEVDITGDPDARGARTASGCRWSRSTASVRSSTTSTSFAALASDRCHKRQEFVTTRRLCWSLRAQWLVMLQAPSNGGAPDRLTVGVAARLSRYLQVLDAGEEDGQGAHLLAGDRRLHEHQRDPDPPRSLELRQVRQARRRLLDRLAARRDPEDPAHAGPAQHRARRRRPARPGDRELADLRRARDQHRRGLRLRPRGRRARRSAARPSRTSAG